MRIYDYKSDIYDKSECGNKKMQAFNNVNACNFYMTDSEVSIS